MNKTTNVVLYLSACTLLVFYGPKIISLWGDNKGVNPENYAQDAHMDQDAYYCLREVASVQLGHIVITYTTDEESGLCSSRFSNKACANLQSDPEQLQKRQETLYEELHEHILLIGPGADVDGSGFVTRTEGARFRDLFEFGHLVANGLEKDNPNLDDWARAAGLDTEQVALNIQDYQKLVTGYPLDLRAFFPTVGISVSHPR